MIESLKQSLEKVKAQKKTHDELVVAAMDYAITHREKFQIWFNFREHGISGWLPINGSAMHVYVDIEGQRGTIDLSGWDSFSSYGGMSKEDTEWVQEEGLLENQEFLDCCTQMMDENIIGFEIDW